MKKIQKPVKMSEEVSEYIINVVETAKLLNIESFVIEKNSTRGKNDDGVMILQQDNIPELPFDGIAFNDILSLQKRVTLFKEFEILYQLKKQRSGVEFPFKTIIKSQSSKTSVEYRCMIPAAVRAPKKMKDPISFSFKMDAEAIDLLMKSKRVMASDTLLLSSKNGKVIFQVCDVDSNVLEHRIASDIDVTDIDESGDTFSLPYKINNLVPILRHMAKQNGDVELGITSRGFLHTKINDLDIYILREKE